MDNLENKVEITFYREQFETPTRKFTDEEWVALSGWAEDFATMAVWQGLADYLAYELEEDVLEQREMNDGLIV